MGGGILTRNAFTLIELLAIIVILAIIAVITVPIILNIIDNSKRGASIDSSYGFKDAIQKYYVTKSVEDTTQELPSGYKAVSALPSDFTVSGEKPSDGWVKLDKGSVLAYSLKIGDYVVTMNNDGDVTSVKNGELAIPDNEVLDNIASYFSNDIDRVVYYNPINGVKCDETDYDSSNSTPGYKGTDSEGNQTSCLKWYKYSTNKDGSINMILDHNTELGTQYYTSSDKSYGPSNLMQYLTLSEWRGVPTRSDKYVAYADNGTTKTVKFTNAPDNAVNYFGKKARLITSQEIAEITGAAATTSPGISWDEQSTSYNTTFYLDSKSRDFSTHRTADNPSTYYWLFEYLDGCRKYGCVNEYQDLANSNNGYWTSSPHAGGDPFNAWYIHMAGQLLYGDVTYSIGVRPVITVPASSIAS